MAIQPMNFPTDRIKHQEEDDLDLATDLALQMPRVPSPFPGQECSCAVLPRRAVKEAVGANSLVRQRSPEVPVPEQSRSQRNAITANAQ